MAILECKDQLDESELEFTLIDGHNRYEICQRLNIQFATIPMQFDTRNEVKLWIIENQDGRRNLTDAWKYQLAQTKKGVLVDIGKAKLSEAGKKGAAITNNALHDRPLSTIDKPREEPKHNTRETIAADLGWSTGKVAMADRVFSAAAPEVLEKVLTNEITINEAYKSVKDAKKLENRAQTIAKIDQLSQGNATLEISKTYPVIYADPPWKYEYSISDSRQIENQYPTMDLSEICVLPVNELATQDG